MDGLFLALVVLLMAVGFLQCTNSMATAYSWLLFRIAQLQCTLFLNTNSMATVYNMLLQAVLEIIQLQQCISIVNIDSMATDSDYSLLLLELAQLQQCIFIAQCYQQYNRILLQQQQDESPVTGTAQQEDDIPVTGTVQQEDDSPVTCTAIQETGEQWLID